MGLTYLPSTSASAAEADPAFNALVFSKTAGFRHDSIPDGIAAIEKLGSEHNFTVDATEDAAQFTDANLAQYDVVIWLSTTGDVLNDDQQAAFERYIGAGGGYAGIHAAGDTEYDWPFYGDLVGAYFLGHPAPQNVRIKTEDQVHPSTADLPSTYTRFDELYNYRTNPRDKVHVLQSYDEKSYTGGTMGAEHPITWCQDFSGGRAWYTGMGHTKESFTEPGFLKEVLGGIRTAAGVVKADCGATQTASFDKVTLDDGTQNPMDMDIAPDGRVFYLERDGRLQIIEPGGGTVTAGRLDVSTVQEFGLLGIELAPDFATSGQLYLYYSPDDGTAHDQVSRFTMNGDTLDLSSEKVVLDVPTQRDQCCHAGGALQFDTKGNLFIAIGDNTNPFASDGYAPIDERPGREAWDAQRTSGNTNDLRGKVLRIHPEPDGTYTIPAGNLFPPGTAKTKPEIYAMGFRNPFKIGIDPRTDTVLVANYGPDAGSANDSRGPDGRVEWDALNQPGNYGWPYCVGANTPYNDYDFATGVSGAKFDCADGPTNDSPNNTGLTKLPPAISADVWYGYSTNPEFAEIGGGGAPMAGSVYTYDPDSPSERKWPAYWDGKAIFGEWNQGKLYSFQLEDGTDQLVDINRILPGMSFLRPHAMEWGADGALYVVEWGSGFGGNNADSGIYRIDYVQGNRSPIAKLSADNTSGPVPLTVAFDSTGSRDPDGTPVTLAWDFDGDGTTDSTEASPTHVYDQAGNYNATLTVTDADGKSATASQAIAAGNTAPTITVESPPDGGFFEFGDQVHYKVTVTDPEDGTIDCNRVITQPALGHNVHAHPYDQYRGCEGTVTVPGDDGHLGADIFGVLTFTYTDQGAPGVDPLTSQEVIVLQPKRKEAEYFAKTGRVGSSTQGDPGVRTETTGDAAGGNQNIGFIEDGDWWSFDPTNLSGIDSVSLRAASPGGGAQVEVRQGSPTGTLVGTVDVPTTGDWQKYQNFSTQLSGTTTESGPLYFVAVKGGLNVNWLDFAGKGVTENQRPELTVDATPVKGTAPLEVDFAATATDPEGDTPLSYAWTFGDGGTAETANPTHTYNGAGTYTAKVTATDAKGASTTKGVEIKVDAQSTVCLTGRSDDFLGASLDTDRWTTVVRGNQELDVTDGKLVIPTSSTDIYGAGAGTTPNIVLQDLPAGPFQATTKLTLPARDKYQQAGLVIYGDDDNYAKMVFEARGDGDAGARIFQFIREESGVPNEVAESNTANLGATYPDTVWVRLSSDGSNLKASYSADGVTFEHMPETKSLAGIDNPKIGLIALQGSGVSVAPVNAEFDWFSIVPDETAAAPGPNDEFDAAALDGCRWNVVRPDPTALRVTGGNLEIDTSGGDIFGAGNSGPRNFVLQDQPDGDWTVETTVDGSAFDERYQQGGLLVYGDDANYVKLDFITDNLPGEALHRRLELRSEVGDTVQDPQPQADPVTDSVWWLRLQKKGTDYTGSYSSDGATWTEIGTVSNTVVADSGKVGLFAFGVDQVASKTAKFDYFRVLDETPPADTTPPTVASALDPVDADGEAGWYVGPVSVTLAATDDREGDLLVEYRTDGGAWMSYTGPVAVDEGSHTFDYRATDPAGNISEVETVEVKHDGTAPQTTASFAPANDEGWHAGSVPVTLSAEDAVSGVAETVYRVDGGDWAPYTDGALTVTGDGVHTVEFRSTDVAGNVEPTKGATIKVDGTQPTVLVSGVVDGRVYGDSDDLVISWQATDETSGVNTVRATLDGEAVESGQVLELYPLSLGVHDLVVSGSDQAGNVTTQSVTFSVETSFDDVATLIERFRQGGRLSDATARTLHSRLTSAEVQAVKGHDEVAVRTLRGFKRQVSSRVEDEQVAEVLTRDADAIIARLNGGASGGAGKEARGQG